MIGNNFNFITYHLRNIVVFSCYFHDYYITDAYLLVSMFLIKSIGFSFLPTLFIRMCYKVIQHVSSCFSSLRLPPTPAAIVGLVGLAHFSFNHNVPTSNASCDGGGPLQSAVNCKYCLLVSLAQFVPRRELLETLSKM